MPSRHKSLKAVIDSSFNQLTEQEKKLFSLIALFQDSFTLEKITASCSEFYLHEKLTDTTLMELLGSLIDKNLIQAERVESVLEDGTRQVCTRYTVLSLITCYARNWLVGLDSELAQASLITPKESSVQQTSNTTKPVSITRRKKPALEYITAKPTVINMPATNSGLHSDNTIRRVSCGLSPPGRASFINLGSTKKHFNI
jgi:hypothetical protein